MSKVKSQMSKVQVKNQRVDSVLGRRKQVKNYLVVLALRLLRSLRSLAMTVNPFRLFPFVRNDRGGFTLIELMIAMVVFVIFVTVMFSTYIYIARAQRDANEERKAIEEAQFLMDEMVLTVRAGTVDYSCYDAAEACGVLLGTDGRAGGVLAIRLKNTGERVLFRRDVDNALTVLYQEKSDLGEWQDTSGLKKLSHEKITIERLEFLITPSADPYTNVTENQFQYQPRVSIFMEIKAPARSRPEGIRVPVQTTVSSRFYSRL